MNICFFNHASILGGGELWVLRAARHLQNAGHTVSVICPYRSALQNKCIAQNIDVFTYWLMEGVPFHEPLEIYLQARRCDVVYCTVMGAFCETQVLGNLINRKNAATPDRPTILVLKTGLPPMAGLPPEYYGAGARACTRRLHVVSTDIKTQILAWTQQIPADFIEVFYEGVELELFADPKASQVNLPGNLQTPPHSIVVTCLARLHAIKGQDNLLLAAAQIVKKNPQVHFFIAGEGEDRDRLEQLTTHLDLHANVHFLGHVDDVPLLLAATDILCHPSLQEGLPNAVIEAMAAGLPVVASAVGGIPEIINDGHTGLLVTPHAIDQLINSIEKLAGDARLRAQLGQAARSAIASRFDSRSNTDALARRLEAELATFRPIASDGILAPIDPVAPVPILFLMHALRTGGEETEIAILSRYLDRRKFAMQVLSLYPTTEDCAAAQVVTVHGIPIDTACHDLAGADAKRDYIVNIIKTHGIRVVVACQDTHLAYDIFNHLPAGACRLIEHGGVRGEESRIPKNHTARYIGVSNDIRNAAAQLMGNPSKALYIPSMVAECDFQPASRVQLKKAYGFDPRECVVTFVGRLDPKKRIEWIAAAAAELLEEYEHLRFLIVGGHDAYQPAYATNLLHATRSLTATGRFVFTGSRSDIPLLLCASDILAFPAVGEGMSHVIAEAGAAGCAVVAADDGAAREQLDNGRCGLLFASHDRDAFVTHIRRLVADARLRRQYGAALRVRTLHHNGASRVIRQWEQILSEVARETGAHVPLTGIGADCLLDFPTEIQIQTTTFCNAACIMCPHPTVSKEVSQGMMDEGLYKHIVEQCAKNRSLHRIEPFLMNEPFMDKRMVDLITWTKQTATHIMVTVTTNGALLTPNVIDRLIDSGLDAVWISFNGHTAATYEQITGISFTEVKKNIEYLLAVRPVHLQVHVNMIETAPMRPEIKANIRYWRSLGVQAGTSPLVNRAGNVPDFDTLDYQDSSTDQIRVCELPFYKMFILYNGQVVPCCMDWRRQAIIGDATQTSLSDIWHGRDLSLMRRLQIENKAHKHRLCAKCSYIRR